MIEQGSSLGSCCIGRFGSTFSSRISAKGKWYQAIGENLSYTNSERGRDHVIELMVDHGMNPPLHRLNIFSTNFSTVGIGFGIHTQYGWMTCSDFAGRYEPNTVQTCSQTDCSETSPATTFSCNGSNNDSTGNNSPDNNSPIKNSPSNNISTSNVEGGSNAGAIVGAVIGVLAVTGIGLGLFWWFKVKGNPGGWKDACTKCKKSQTSTGN